MSSTSFYILSNCLMVVEITRSLSFKRWKCDCASVLEGSSAAFLLLQTLGCLHVSPYFLLILSPWSCVFWCCFLPKRLSLSLTNLCLFFISRSSSSLTSGIRERTLYCSTARHHSQQDFDERTIQDPHPSSATILLSNSWVTGFIYTLTCITHKISILETTSYYLLLS